MTSPVVPPAPRFAAARAFIARARTDPQDRLIDADEPLAGLHQRCGGDAGGVLAIPQMLALVRKARRYGMPLARAIAANDGEDRIKAWVEAVPLGVKGSDGCDLGIGSWQVTPITHSDEQADASRRIEVNRAAAELTARLDNRQNLLFAESSADDLQAIAAQMQRSAGRPWTDFVSFPGNDYRQPLHWRLLDGATCQAEGSTREWRAILAPLGETEPGSAGFELFLISDQSLPHAEKPATATAALANPKLPAMDNTPSLGRDLAPVLRQPVARIIANAETIRTRLAGPLADEYSDYAADIAAAGQHLLALIDDLTDLEVVESDRFSTAPDEIDMVDVVRRAAGILGVRARAKQIELALPPAGIVVPAIGEFRRVLQILLNLIGNAISYSPAGSRIEIGARVLGDVATVTITDQGPGLTKAQQLAAFKKFERLGRSDDGGSGLGLYISRRLTEAMDGSLTVESLAGEGARFLLQLPGQPGHSQ